MKVNLVMAFLLGMAVMGAAAWLLAPSESIEAQKAGKIENPYLTKDGYRYTAVYMLAEVESRAMINKHLGPPPSGRGPNEVIYAGETYVIVGYR